VFSKSVHSAMFASNVEGQSLDYWLRKHGVGRIIVSGIRTEQCCETTTRHASDLGYAVSYAIDATLTFKMVSDSGRVYTPQDIMDRTELVLAGRFAQVSRVEALPL
jgi:nicotinamidase-related amidase